MPATHVLTLHDELRPVLTVLQQGVDDQQYGLALQRRQSRGFRRQHKRDLLRREVGRQANGA